MRPLHLPQGSPVSSLTPVPAPVTSPTFSTVSAPFLTAFTTASRETFLQPQTEERIRACSSAIARYKSASLKDL